MASEIQDKYILRVMQAGYEKAASSFSILIKKPVRIKNSQPNLFCDSNGARIEEETGELFVLVTQVIGDLSGKSFLIFNEQERNHIFNILNDERTCNLKEAFLAEIDNIISASVISEISNAYNIEVYGDVPQLVKLDANRLHQFIKNDEEDDDTANIIFSNSTFSFADHDHIHPQFIWKFNKRIFDLVPSNKTVLDNGSKT